MIIGGLILNVYYKARVKNYDSNKLP